MCEHEFFEQNAPDPYTYVDKFDNFMFLKYEQTTNISPAENPFNIRVVSAEGYEDKFAVVEFAADIPEGEIQALANVRWTDDALVLEGLHVGGPGSGHVGIKRLRQLVTELGRLANVERVEIHGGVRTTGAKPGHTPRPMIFPVGENP